MIQKIIKSVLAFDLDGTLTQRNRLPIQPASLIQLFNELTDLGHVIIPITGKPVNYVKQFLTTNHLTDSGIIAENAGVYRLPDHEKVAIFGPGTDKIGQLKTVLDINHNNTNVTSIFINKHKFQIAIDPDDISILTIFTDPAAVSHRWQFKQSIKADDLFKQLNSLLEKLNMSSYLTILPPFPDGAVQIIRKDPTLNQNIDKSYLLPVLMAMYPHTARMPIAMFGDDQNDIPAMAADRVMAITFKNSAAKLKTFVKSKNGYVTPNNAVSGEGVKDGITWLTKQQFFGPDNQKVIDILNRYAKS